MSRSLSAFAAWRARRGHTRRAASSAQRRAATVAGAVIALGAIAVPSAARADVPLPTATTSLGSTVPTAITSTTATANADGSGGSVLVGDAFPQSLATLTAASGGDVTIVVSGPVDDVAVTINSTPIPVATVGERTYMITLRGDLPLPARMDLRLRHHDETSTTKTQYGLDLVPPPSPTVIPAPTPPVAVPGQTGAIQPRSLRLRGNRISLAIACPADAGGGCEGAVTLRTASVRVARLTYVRVAAGSTRTLSATLKRSALRHLKRHRTTKLNASIRTGRGKATVSKIRLH